MVQRLALKNLEADFTCAAELRQENLNEVLKGKCRGAFPRDQNDDIITILPALTKNDLRALGMHTGFVHLTDDTALVIITGSSVVKNQGLISQARRVLLIVNHHLTLLNQELSDICQK